MNDRNSLTAEKLRELLHYCPETGRFTWLKPPWNHPRMLGKEAGCDSTGYTMIRIAGGKYKAHRLAWLYVHGELPSRWLDHRDGNPFNNAISNLRLATAAQNCANAKLKAGKTLPKGVRLSQGKFTARIRFEGQLITIGTFATPDAAAAAYYDAAQSLYGEFARVG